MENLKNLKQYFEAHDTAEPKLVSLEYDTCRVLFPESEQYVTFELHNITDAFLASERTERDMRAHGVELVLVPPNTRITEAASANENAATHLSAVSDARIAERLGVSQELLAEAQALALDALLTQLQKQKRRAA